LRLEGRKNKRRYSSFQKAISYELSFAFGQSSFAGLEAHLQQERQRSHTCDAFTTAAAAAATTRRIYVRFYKELSVHTRCGDFAETYELCNRCKHERL